MNQIDKLIQQYCPNGVPMVKLGEVMQIVRGASPRPINAFLTDKENGIHWIKIGDVSSESKYITNTEEYITPEGALKSRFLHVGDFILSNSMSFGRPYILQIDGCVHDGWISMSGYEGSFLPDFLYYVLKSDSVQNFWKQKANNGGAMSNLNADIVRLTPIPLPLLPVQEEIVRELDAMTDLLDNLDQEIAARKKEYEHYREQLLTFGDDVETVSVGEGCQLKARVGWQGLTKKEYLSSGNYLLVTGTDFTPHYRINFDTCVYVDKERYIQDEYIQLRPEDILITKDGTLGKIAYIENLPYPTTLNGGVFVVRDMTGKLYSKFLMYYLSSNQFSEFIEKNHTSGSIMHLTQALLVKFLVPAPNLSVQQAIVEKLDAFEALIQNLEQERNLRQKQYEYYREKLLTF